MHLVVLVLQLGQGRFGAVQLLMKALGPGVVFLDLFDEVEPLVRVGLQQGNVAPQLPRRGGRLHLGWEHQAALGEDVLRDPSL